MEHVDGYEENTEPENLTWACRSCNTQKGIVFRNLGIGRRTRQYNPPSFSLAAAGLAGRRVGAAAKQAGRPRFGVFEDWIGRHAASLPEEPTAAEVEELRKAFFTGYRQRKPAGARSLRQYLTAVMSLKGQGDLDLQAAIDLIHNTPHSKRSEFAREIWSLRRQRGTDEKSSAVESEVPF